MSPDAKGFLQKLLHEVNHSDVDFLQVMQAMILGTRKLQLDLPDFREINHTIRACYPDVPREAWERFLGAMILQLPEVDRQRAEDLSRLQ